MDVDERRTEGPANHIELEAGSTVGVIGGGPAGAFFAIHLLRGAKRRGKSIRVTIFERRWGTGAGRANCPGEHWQGCNYCAGGISPKLNDVLRELEMTIPDGIIQGRIQSVTIQGFWKNIELEVPPGREMLAVYRGSRPGNRCDHTDNFDSFLLDQAVKAGAGVVTGEVKNVEYNGDFKPRIHYLVNGDASVLDVDLAVFAVGVNEQIGNQREHGRVSQCLQKLIPRFEPPKVRQALIFELETAPRPPPGLREAIHFVEYGTKSFALEMCSLVPKRRFVTVTLVGACVDAATQAGNPRGIVRQFLEMPHIRKLLSPAVQAVPACFCRPNLVTGSARHPYADRVAAVGDLVCARLYKDGILSAERTARALAEAVLEQGIDVASFKQGYEPTLRRFRIDNRAASLVFLLHRIFFSSSVLSRVLYQAVINQRKTKPAGRRRLENLLWRIASGDDDYRRILQSMVHPQTVWAVLATGGVMTLRNYLTELCFGLRWEGFGRFTTGVALERLEAKRKEFSRLIADASVAIPGRLEFERMYTIKIAAPRNRILEEIGRFGEADRGYLKPRWLRVQRIAGMPNVPGCLIRYEVGSARLSFTLVLEQLVGGHLAVYRVRDGFAKGGILVFEIERLSDECCALSIYVAYNFARGATIIGNGFWWLFRRAFPAFVHDVLWNHSLCQLKDIVEAGQPGAAAFPSPALSSVQRPCSAAANGPTSSCQ